MSQKPSYLFSSLTQGKFQADRFQGIYIERSLALFWKFTLSAIGFEVSLTLYTGIQKLPRPFLEFSTYNLASDYSFCRIIHMSSGLGHIRHIGQQLKEAVLNRDLTEVGLHKIMEQFVA